jgi:hypothetical protein
VAFVANVVVVRVVRVVVDVMVVVVTVVVMVVVVVEVVVVVAVFVVVTVVTYRNVRPCLLEGSRSLLGLVLLQATGLARGEVVQVPANPHNPKLRLGHQLGWVCKAYIRLWLWWLGCVMLNVVLVWLVVALLDGLMVGVVVVMGVVVVKPHVANDVSRDAANAFVTMPMVISHSVLVSMMKRPEAS